MESEPQRHVGTEFHKFAKPAIIEHYSRTWDEPFADTVLLRGQGRAQIPWFSVLSFAPREPRKLWTYATCGMSAPMPGHRVELHLFSSIASFRHVETLTAVAHYHLTGNRISLGHTVNFGRPWLAKSVCEYGLISRPYLDGPKIENLILNPDESATQCLWLIPITLAERDFGIREGLEKLEDEFERSGFHYADPSRCSVVD